jgi:hypothetical protein
VREAWEAREAEAAVDEARRETSPLELRKDRDVIANLSQLVQKFFANVKGLRMETEDVLYQAAVTIAVTLGYTEDHISVPPTKYEFLEDMASMLEQQDASPSVINMLLQTTAKRLDFYTIHDYVHAILHLISTEEIEPRLGADMPVGPAGLPTQYSEAEDLSVHGPLSTMNGAEASCSCCCSFSATAAQLRTAVLAASSSALSAWVTRAKLVSSTM